MFGRNIADTTGHQTTVIGYCLSIVLCCNASETDICKQRQFTYLHTEQLVRI